ncbi:hypothetical protein SDC9_147160 [bioreactor metagenome]|uniref:Uncharacterized protein n=1 Tax=bioreactor metagenome TaxID=1076179 RepID=A0A645EEX4_9ZZZZ
MFDKRKIQEAFRLSEMFTPTGESITPIYKVRENMEKLLIEENELQEYLYRYNPKEYHVYIDQAIQKIYHPTEDNLKKDEILRLSGLR